MQVMVHHLSFNSVDAQKQLLVKCMSSTFLLFFFFFFFSCRCWALLSHVLALHPAIWKSVTEWLFVIEELLFENKKCDNTTSASSTQSQSQLTPPIISTTPSPIINNTNYSPSPSTKEVLSSSAGGGVTGKAFEHKVIDIHRR
jgi:hypothetical protein